MNEKNIKFYQQYFVKNSKAFIITFTALNSLYDKLEKEAREIINTLKIK
jgi:hypothetical protein